MTCSISDVYSDDDSARVKSDVVTFACARAALLTETLPRFAVDLWHTLEFHW